MTDVEKELVEIFDSYAVDVPESNRNDLAKAVIEKYPQVLKKPVELMIIKSDIGAPHYRVETLVSKFLEKDKLKNYLDSVYYKTNDTEVLS